MKVLLRLIVVTAFCFLAVQLSVTTAQLQTMRTVLNDAWDKGNHRLMTTSWGGNVNALETETTIFNDVWDPTNHLLRTSTSGGGSGDFSSNTATSVDGEIVVFSGTSGKTGKRATGSGLATLTNGVLGVTTAPTGVIVGVSDTQTLTGKTYDVEATGNVFTSTHKIWMPGAGCQNATATLFWDTPVSGAVVATCITGINTQKGVADFADGVNLSMQQTFLLPGDFTGGIDAKFKWLSSVTTGNVQWFIATACVADAETDDPAFNTASSIVDGVKGTANQTNDASIIGIVTTGCAAGELMHVKVSRDATGGNASDTLAGIASLIGVELTVRRTQ